MMTWDEAERLHPGCSAEWDVTSSKFSGTWVVEDLFENASDGITVFVKSTDAEFSDDSERIDYKWAYFSFNSSWTLGTVGYGTWVRN